MATIGEIDEIPNELSIHWKIKEFFSLSKEVYSSSLFSFANESWCLRLYPNGNKSASDYTTGYISVYLRKKSLGPSIEIEYCLNLKMLDGKKAVKFKEIFEFGMTEQGRGEGSFLSRSELLERKCELMPSDIFTIVCTLKLSESTKDTIKNIKPGSSELMQQSKILQDFKELYLKQEDCDVTIRVKEQDFSAHKIILKARSPVFASTFRNDMKEKATGIVNIEDCDPSIFSEFLRYLYCEDVDSLSSKNVFSLFTVADKYDVSDLKLKCIKFIKENLSIDTFCETITLALKHSNTELVDLATEFFIKNADNIILTAKWQSFISENPIQGNELFVKFMASDRCVKV